MKRDRSPISFRLTPGDMVVIDELAKLLTVASPIGRTEAIRIATRRCLEVEQKKNSKKSRVGT